MSFCERLKVAREKMGYTKTKLADLLGYGTSTVSEYERGTNKPNLDTFIKLCNILNCDANYFLQDDIEYIESYINPEDKHILTRYHHLTPNNKSIVDYIFGLEEEEVVEPVQKQLSENTIHLLDMGELISIDTYTEKVSAGNGNTTVTGHKVSKLYPTSKIASKATYAARITGNSMEPRFAENDIIYVNGNKIPVHDEIGVFTYNGETYCKKYYAIDGVEKLISLNNSYSPIIIDSSLQFEKQGVVIGRFHAD